VSRSLSFAQSALAANLADHAAMFSVVESLAAAGFSAEAAQLYSDFEHRWRRDYEMEPPEAVARRAREIVSRAAHRELPVPAAATPAQPAAKAVMETPSLPPALSSTSMPKQERRPRRLAGRLLTASVALVVLYAGLRATRDAVEDDTDPRLVQVLPFASGADDEAGRMIADWLIQGIAAADVDVVPLALAQWAGDSVAGPGSTRPGLVIRGTVVYRGDSAFVQASIADANGRRVGILETLGAERSDLLGLAESLRQRVLPVLAAHLHENTTAWATAARPPTSFDAYRAFAAGMDEFYVRNYPAATAHYERAIAADPDWVLPRLWLTFSLGNSGATSQRVQQNVLDFWPQRERMTRFEAALADYQYANAGLDPEAKRNETTWHATRRLIELLPASEWLYLHGVASLAHNRPRAAMQTLLRADPDRGWLRNWRAYWLMLSLSAHYAGDLQRSLDAARTGFARDPKDWGILEEIGGAQAALGITTELDSLAVIAATIANERQLGAVGPRIYWGRELRAHGFEDSAREQFAKAVDTYERLTAEEQARPRFRAHYGLALYEAQRYGEALAVFRELAVSEAGDIEDRVHAAVTALRLGDAAEARALVGEVLASDDPYRYELAAWLWTELGHPEEATAAFRRQAELPRPNVQWQHLHEYDWVRRLAREHPPFAELIRPKG
jgi:tetratricopeptide (TPR) repeat protein